MRSLEKVVSERVRELLQENGRNQRWLSEETGIQQGYLNELMNNKPHRRWNIDHIEKVAEALDVPPWHLFTAPENAIPSDSYELIRLYNKLDEVGKRIVDGVLRTSGNGQNDKRPKEKVT